MAYVKQVLFVALIMIPQYINADDEFDFSSFGEETSPAAATSDNTSAPIGSTAPASTTSSSGSDVKSEQLEGPDILKLEEKDDSGGTNNTEIKKVFVSGQSAVADMNKGINALTKTREQLYQKYFSLTDNIDDVLQATQASLGVLNQIFNPVDTK